MPLVHIRERLSNLDSELQELLMKGAGVFAIRIFGAGLTFLMYLYLGRLLGAAGFGLFSLAYTLISILAIFSRLGLDTLTMRSVAAHDEAHRSGHARAELKPVLTATLIASVIVIAILATASQTISTTLFGKPELQPVLLGMTPFLLFMVIGYLIGEAFKGLHHTITAMLIQYGTHPLLFLILLVLIASVSTPSPELVAQLFSATAIPVVIVSLIYWYKTTRYNSTVVIKSVISTTKNGLPMLLMATGGLLLSWTDVIVLGIFESKESVGIYSVASRTALLTNLVLVTVNAIVAPKFSQLYSKGDMDGLKQLANRATRMMIVIVIAPTLILIFVPEWVLGLFGEEFSVGATILIVLTIGQFVSVACGSVGYLLIMTNHEKVMQMIMLVSALVNIVLSVALVHVMGVIGVAWATAISAILWNVWSLFEVKKRVGFWMFR